MDKFRIHDAGVVSSAGAVTNGCFIAAPATTGTGVYTLTFDSDQGIDATEAVVVITPILAAGDVRVASYTHTSDTVITVTFHDEANAAADSGFSFMIYKLPG